MYRLSTADEEPEVEILIPHHHHHHGSKKIRRNPLKNLDLDFKFDVNSFQPAPDNTTTATTITTATTTTITTLTTTTTASTGVWVFAMHCDLLLLSQLICDCAHCACVSLYLCYFLLVWTITTNAAWQPLQILVLPICCCITQPPLISY